MLQAEIVIKTSGIDRNRREFDVASFTPEMLEKLRLAYGATEVKVVGDKLIAILKAPVELTENVRIKDCPLIAGQVMSDRNPLVIHSPHPDDFALVKIQGITGYDPKDTYVANEKLPVAGEQPMKRNASGREYLGIPLSEEIDVEVLKVIVDNLFSLLDDIDTSSDVLKPRDEESYKKFYESTMRRVAKRWALISSDGYGLFVVKDKPVTVAYHPV